VELSEHKAEFDALGIQVVVMTYEAPEKNLKFTSQHDIGYIFLSDPESRHIKAFGILNETYGPDSMAHGIPHPGIFLVDGNGNINAKFAEEGYRDRPILSLVIEAASNMVKTSKNISKAKTL
jgi:peroxiredoxin